MKRKRAERYSKKGSGKYVNVKADNNGNAVFYDEK